MARRVLLIGLDCVPPSLAFSRFATDMPCLSALCARGAFAALRSTFPPITVPAWTAMISGRDPGELGLYGFRKRERGRYELSLVSARDVAAPRLWDVLGQAGKRSSVLFVPPSYPPAPIHGELLSCFLTPDDAPGWAHPPALGGELEARFGRYIRDVRLREGSPETFVESLVAMARQHFAMARHVWEERGPDFMMMVEIGPDRLHHALFVETVDDAADRLMRHYYRALDHELELLLAAVGPETTVLVASDHGARPLRSVFRINEWLRREGWLVLKEGEPRDGPCALAARHVDFSRTRAWAEGGYYARVFLNVAGREPEGIVAEGDRLAERERLASALMAIGGPAGEVWTNRVERPEQMYRAVRGDAPDLMLVLDDLAVRPISTVGQSELHARHDDRGPDGANHDWLGIFALAGPGVCARGDLGEVAIHDVGATVCALFGLPLPSGWLGRDRSRP